MKKTLEQVKPVSNDLAESIDDLIKSTNIPAGLVRAVVAQIGGWESFTESARAIADHGIDGGFSGFVYYTETEKFAKDNLKEIQALAQDQAGDFGCDMLSMIQGFGCFRGSKPSLSEIGRALFAGEADADAPNVLNALAWYAGEEVSRAYCDMLDNK